MSRRGFLLKASTVGLTALTGGCGADHARTARKSVLTRGARPHGPGPPLPRTLRQAIRGRVFEPGQPGFPSVAHLFNPRFDGVIPGAVARPIDSTDVQNALRFTTARGLPVRARSGGHSYAGYSTGADCVVIDLRHLTSISVDKRRRTATVGAGAQLIDVYSTLARSGVTLPAGSCPSVGVSGVTLGGGFGLAARRFGLTADNLRAVTIVTADAKLRTVDARTDPELLWALKGGGGGNFGIVTKFTFNVHPIPRVATYFNVTWPWAAADDAIAAWQAWAPHTDDRATSILHLNSGSPPTINANGQYLGTPASLLGLLGPLLAAPGAALTSRVALPYLDMQLLLAGCAGQALSACHTVGTARGGTMPRNTFTAKSDYVSRPLSRSGRAAMIAAAEVSGAGALLCDAYGGAVSRVAPAATAFVHREQLFCIQYYGDGASNAWIDQAWRKMRPYVSGEAYQNYIDPSLQRWQRAYYAQNLSRLEAVRRRVDPHHYFNFPQAIGR